MVSNIGVKVVGFSEAERHSLNTLFRLSAHNNTAYALWVPEGASAPHVALIDTDCYEAGLEVASPSFNANLKLICVGGRTVKNAWRSFARPVDWRALLHTLDELFASQADVDIDLGMEEPVDKTAPPGIKVSLLVGLCREDRLYLRARLALAGLTDVDESPSVVDAGKQVAQRHYDLVILGMGVSDADPWALVQSLKEMPTPICSVIVVTAAPSWHAMERAEALGCTGLLEIPFNPRQVIDLLQKV
ncbi:MAG: hypothetical protein Q8R67_22715 [Rhodoferax sp.]|nr:hypothetical protein [Rhodoferax sp.]MDP3654486.1 hypothetical protein [Rhodoferax sp.]